jgi:hypothetical protein
MNQPDQQAKITEVQARYADALMQKAHVVGVAIGLRKKDDVYTDEFCLVVMVDQKVPLDELAPEDQIPAEIEGVPVDVQAMGSFSAF